MTGTSLIEPKKFNTMAGVWTVLALLASAIEPIIIKIGYQGTVSPYQLLIIKSLTAAVLILPITRKFSWIGWKGIKTVSSVSVLLLLNNLFMLLALGHVSVIVYLTLTTTVPSVIALINMALGREKIGIKFWLGFSLCFLGVLMSLDVRGSGFGETNWFGIAMVIGCMICSIIYRIKMETITEEYAPVIISLYIFWINAVFVVFFFLPWAGSIPVSGWKIGLWIGFSAAVANVAFVAALHILGATRISIFNLLQRPLIMVAAAFILHEPLTWLQIIGIAVVLIGVHFAKVEKRTA